MRSELLEGSLANQDLPRDSRVILFIIRPAILIPRTRSATLHLSASLYFTKLFCCFWDLLSFSLNPGPASDAPGSIWAVRLNTGMWNIGIPWEPLRFVCLVTLHTPILCLLQILPFPNPRTPWPNLKTGPETGTIIPLSKTKFELIAGDQLSCQSLQFFVTKEQPSIPVACGLLSLGSRPVPSANLLVPPTPHNKVENVLVDRRWPDPSTWKSA